MDNAVEFVFHIQEIPNRNLVGKFIDKIKTNLVGKGLVEHKDYEIEIESDDLPIIQNEMMVGGATDSTFPYSIIEGLLDYIDNNVRVIKSENIQTDEYDKTANKRQRVLDGLFTKTEVKDEIDKGDDGNKPVLPNSWDKLYINETKPDEPKPDEKSTSSLFDRLFTLIPKPETENIKIKEDKNKSVDTESPNIVLEEDKNKSVDTESPNIVLEEPNNKVPLSKNVEKVRSKMIEIEYVVKIKVVKDKVKSIGELGKREIMK